MAHPSLEPIFLAIARAGLARVTRNSEAAGVVVERSEAHEWCILVQPFARSNLELERLCNAMGMAEALAKEEADCRALCDQLAAALAARGLLVQRAGVVEALEVWLENPADAAQRRAAAPLKPPAPQQFDLGALPIFSDHAGQQELF